MKDFQMSENVKQYFVRAFKSLGFSMYKTEKSNNLNDIQFTKFEEFSEAQIQKGLLENSQVGLINLYYLLKQSILRQLQNDARSNQEIQEKTIFDRATLKRILIDSNVNEKGIFTAENCDSFLRNLTASEVDESGRLIFDKENKSIPALLFGINLDEVAGDVILAIKKGLSEQNLTVEEKREASEIWDSILYAQFKKDLQNNKDPECQYQAEEFEAWQQDHQASERYSQFYEKNRVDKLFQKVVHEIMHSFKAGLDETDAKKLVYQKVDGEILERLSANGNLLQESKNRHIDRCLAEGKNPKEEPMVLGDVFVAAGNVQTSMMTFLQSRSAEQENGERKEETTKANKIGNVLGQKGREFVKSVAKRGISISYDAPKGIKPGKRGPWRGFKNLAERIERFMANDLYATVQAVGFSQAMITRATGYSFAPKNDYQYTEEILKKPERDVIAKPEVKTDYTPMPDRCLTDGKLNLAGEFYQKTKARILWDKTYLANLEIAVNKKGLSMENPGVKAQVNYLRSRIEISNHILAQKIPEVEAPEFNDPTYYEKLDKEIFRRDDYKNVGAVKHFLDDTAMQSSAAQMLDNVFKKFVAVTNNYSTLGVKVKREIAKDIFNLHSMSQENLPESAIDAIVDRFSNSTLYQQVKTDLASREQAPMVVLNTMDKIDQFVVDDLKNNAFKNKFEEHELEQKIADEKYNEAMTVYEKKMKEKQYREELIADVQNELSR